MTFSVVCLLAAIVTMLFGLGFLLAPEMSAAQYGISGWNAGTLLVARLFGIGLINIGVAALAVRDTTDARTRRSMSTWFALIAALALALSLQAVIGGAVNSLGWLSVAIYGFFTLAWASVAFGEKSR
jgi:hypothetical protein